MRALTLLLLLLGSPPAIGRAQEAPIRASLRAPAMAAGDRAVVVLSVRGAGPHPLLVTPRSEGTALEVVRGRMLRAEAVDPSAEVLEFRIPVVARAAGAAVLRVRVDGYACEARCRRVQAEAAQVVNVAAAREAPGKASSRASSKRFARRIEPLLEALSAAPSSPRLDPRPAAGGRSGQRRAELPSPRPARLPAADVGQTLCLRGSPGPRLDPARR